jgi:hypothetical protein
MIERDKNSSNEGAGTMLFRAMKCLLSILPQSTCYKILRDRMISISRFRQSAIMDTSACPSKWPPACFGGVIDTDIYVERVRQVRSLHCAEAWIKIRGESLEAPASIWRESENVELGDSRRRWLGFESKEEDNNAQKLYRDEKKGPDGIFIEEITSDYQNLHQLVSSNNNSKLFTSNERDEVKPTTRKADKQGVLEEMEDDEQWKGYWEDKG